MVVIGMWINGCNIKRNDQLTYFQIKYIQDKTKEMVKRLSDKYVIHLKKSVHSEACYLKIRGNQGESYIVSIRNHSSSHSFDNEIYLSDFRTWEELEDYFICEVLS